MASGGGQQDADGNYLGHAEIEVTARDMAKLGLLFLNEGEYEGKQILPASWISDSLQRYSEGLGTKGSFRDRGYGYQWWSARVGDRYFNYASGHGGQLIVLLDELDMIVVATADPQYLQLGGEAWKHEVAVFDLVGKFINSLPRE